MSPRWLRTIFPPSTRLDPTATTGSGLSRWSLVRFNPFGDTGGNHSFVICLLDTGNNGIILTSLHGRGVTRFYAKRVVAGRAEDDLSSEEKQSLNQALQ